MGLIRSPESNPALVEFASEVGRSGPVVVQGGATHWSVGGDVDPSARVIGAPVGIVEIRADEMTVEVGAGTLVSDLHTALRPTGQRTALPEVEGSTVGGAIAVGRSGIERLGRGQTRDAVLQIHYVSADGDLVTAGGPTVKNVSGFDVVRLFVGSLGTLGCMADVILRTQPIPDMEVWSHLDNTPPEQVFDRCATASSILWNGESVWILTAGYVPDVEADLDALRQLGPLTPDQPPELPPNRWSRRPAESLTTTKTDFGSFVVEVGVGLVHTDRPVAPVSVSAEVAALRRRMKAAFDPTGRLNPGRSAGEV